MHTSISTAADPFSNVKADPNNHVRTQNSASLHMRQNAGGGRASSGMCDESLLCTYYTEDVLYSMFPVETPKGELMLQFVTHHPGCQIRAESNK